MEYLEDDAEKVQDSQQHLLELKNRGLIVVAMALKDAVTNKNNCSLPNQIKRDYSPDKRREQFNNISRIKLI
jgi:ABC-type lipoprotein export system ATPase subunit